MTVDAVDLIDLYAGESSGDEEYEFPASDAQSRLLVLDQLNPGSPSTTSRSPSRCTGPSTPPRSAAR